MTRIIDSHCHIYPDKIAGKAVEAISHFYEGLSWEHHDGTTDTLIRSGNEVGITHFVVHSVATTPKQVSSINHFIADKMNSANGAFIGLGAMHPDSENMEADVQEILDLGLYGVKVHPDFQKFQADSPKAFHMYELLEDAGLPLLMHTGDYRYDYSNPDRVANILKNFPKLKLIGAHFAGWSVWEEAAKVLPDYPNLWVDTSSSFPCIKPERAKELIRLYGSERVMFGTDYPLWVQQPDLDYIKRLELTDEEYENIYWKTCAKLYNLDLQE